VFEGLFEKYDTDRDGYLTVENFMEFYHEAATSRGKVVYENLSNLGYRVDLSKLSEEVSEEIAEEDLVKNILHSYPKLYDFIFDALNRNDDLGEQAVSLANKLPPYAPVYDNLLKFEGLKFNEETKTYDWSTFIQSDSIYKIKYYMAIIDYFMEEADQEEGQIEESEMTANKNESYLKKQWRTEFIKFGGFNYFVQLLKSASKGEFNSSDSMVIYSFVLKMLKKYIEAAVSKTSKDIYMNLSFITNNWFDYATLLKAANEEQVTDDKKSEDMKETKDTKDVATQQKATCGPVWKPQSGTMSNDEIKKMKGTEKTLDKLFETRLKKLKESPDFIAFRDSISQELANELIGTIDVIPTIE